ncbi:MAG: hypothetical protein EXQ56_05780 [Acidobacteria bacterium]|nr:hypothetical protein [Acidobacteriota bacterium]
MQAIYYVKSVDNSRLVPLARPGEPRQYLISTLLGVVLLGALLFSAMGRFQTLENGYRIERLEREKKIALEANRKLQLEEASLGDPLRIDWIARNELGMRTLAPNQIFRAEPLPPATLAAPVGPGNTLVLTARIQPVSAAR